MNPLNLQYVDASHAALPLMGCGTFAEVRLLAPLTVLKATACPLTQRLYREARNRPEAWPRGLPAILADLGPVARDGEGVEYRGYVVERLFRPGDWRAASPAVRALRNSALISQGKQGQTPVKATNEEGTLNALLSLSRSAQPSPEEGGWAAQRDFAVHLAALVHGELRVALLFLADFVHRHRACFDLAREDNFLLDCDGQVRISDPASVGSQATGRSKPRKYLLARMPVELTGLRTLTRPYAAPIEAGTDVSQRIAALRALGVSSRITESARDVTGFLGSDDQLEPVFAYRALRDHLEHSAYERLLYGNP